MKFCILFKVRIIFAVPPWFLDIRISTCFEVFHTSTSTWVVFKWLHHPEPADAPRIAGNFDRGENLTFLTLSSQTVKIKPVNFLSQYSIW